MNHHTLARSPRKAPYNRRSQPYLSSPGMTIPRFVPPQNAPMQNIFPSTPAQNIHSCVKFRSPLVPIENTQRQPVPDGRTHLDSSILLPSPIQDDSLSSINNSPWSPSDETIQAVSESHLITLSCAPDNSFLGQSLPRVVAAHHPRVGKIGGHGDFLGPTREIKYGQVSPLSQEDSSRFGAPYNHWKGSSSSRDRKSRPGRSCYTEEWLVQTNTRIDPACEQKSRNLQSVAVFEALHQNDNIFHAAHAAHAELSTNTFPYFEELPVEIRRCIIVCFINNEAGPVVSSQALWDDLTITKESKLQRSNVLDNLMKKIHYFRECMLFGTPWYQLISQFLMKNPVINSLEGAKNLHQWNKNFVSKQFSHLRQEWGDLKALQESNPGFQDCPGYLDFLDGRLPSGIDDHFSEPINITSQQVIIAPSNWTRRADGDYPGGPTAYSGWGNAWMIQDALRAYPNVERLVVALGSTGEYAWAFPSSGVDLSKLTHLHLDVPLSRHFHPGACPIERFRSFSCVPPGTAADSMPTFLSSHHLCPIFRSMAPTLEILSIHGTGAHMCHELFNTHWERLKILRCALDEEDIGICNAAFDNTARAAQLLKTRLPGIELRLTMFVEKDEKYYSRPYVWGGIKPCHPGVRKFKEDNLCCLTCCWNLECSDNNHQRHTFYPALLAYKRRCSLGIRCWLEDVSTMRHIHHYDPLNEARDHCGDIGGDWMRVSSTTLPKPDQWLDTSRPKDPETLKMRCGIMQEENDPRMIQYNKLGHGFSFVVSSDPRNRRQTPIDELSPAVQAWIDRIES